MTLQGFIIRSALRNKRRAALSVFSAGFSLFLLFFVVSLRAYFLDPPHAKEGDLRLIVAPETPIISRLPVAYMAKIEKAPHVVGVSSSTLVPTTYKNDPHNFIRTMAVLPDRFWRVFPDVHVTPELKAEFEKTKRAALVGSELMDAYGWKPGDLVTLHSAAAGGIDLELRVAGVYDWRFRSNIIFFRQDYLDDVRGDEGRVSMFWVMADSPDHMAEIKEAIDGQFANSGDRTHTETERAFIVSMLGRMGNMRVVMGAVGAVVVFTMLLVSAAAMMQSMRERVREVGILKSLGFPWTWVLAMLLGEAAFLALLGGVVASGLSFVLLAIPIDRMSDGVVSAFRILPGTLAGVVLSGVVLGVLAALPPTILAARIPALEAMKRMD